MAKITAYLRIGRRDSGSFSVAATSNPSDVPLKDGNGRDIPTVAFGVRFNIPDAVFDSASRVIAELTIPEEALVVPKPADIKILELEGGA